VVFSLFRRGDTDGLEVAEGKLIQMLADDRHSFDVATSALLTGADTSIVGPDLRASDARVNKAERELRQALVVHASVHGTSRTASILVYMSVVKDVERIGDYAKNIYDVAAQGVDLSTAPDRDQLIQYRDRISSMISEASTIFTDDDRERAARFISEADALLDEFDGHVSELITAEEPGREAVPRALLFRYYKRIVAHLMNLLSAVVMPLDRLDYFDEDRVRP
jgi:phosphate transport system protein